MSAVRPGTRVEASLAESRDCSTNAKKTRAEATTQLRRVVIDERLSGHLKLEASLFQGLDHLCLAAKWHDDIVSKVGGDEKDGTRDRSAAVHFQSQETRRYSIHSCHR